MKKQPVHQKLSRFLSFFNRHRLLAVFLLIVIALAAIFLIPYGIDQCVRSQDRPNVVRMRAVVKDIQGELAQVDSSLSWQDESYCTVIRSRSFGEDERYMCEATWSTSKVVSSQQAVNAVVDGYQDVISQSKNIRNTEPLSSYPVFTTDSNILQAQDVTGLGLLGSSSFAAQGVNGNCAINYKLAQSGNDTVRITVDVGCILVTYGAYFKPIEYV